MSKKLKHWVVTRCISGREGVDYFVTEASTEDTALRKIARYLYDPEDNMYSDFKGYYKHCTETDCGDILDAYEAVKL